ncbi:hypothetical protein chiPu_0016934 [Chiloscyllium punctatum]|uniref:Uncharacterized protein n=1 Tax=Chiloscyllium punctatum TaxID=137246 RepID=A0A401T708_CHIPU|nr:hypothetical protein [Chiloscyllium punctatum]
MVVYEILLGMRQGQDVSLTWARWSMNYGRGLDYETYVDMSECGRRRESYVLVELVFQRDKSVSFPAPRPGYPGLMHFHEERPLLQPILNQFRTPSASTSFQMC